MVKVIKGSVKFDGKYYQIGESVSGLSESDEARLIEAGVCEAVGIVAEETTDTEKKQNKKAQPKTKTESIKTDKEEPVDALQIDAADCVVGK